MLLQLLCTIVAVVTSLLTFIFIRFRTSSYWKLIDAIPGPKAYPLIGCLPDLWRERENLFYMLRKYNRRWYPIYREWFLHNGVVNIQTPEDVEVILSSSRHIQKGKVYDFLEPWLKTGLLTSSGSKWQTRRKILTPAFHFNILQEFTMIIAEQTEHLVEKLKPEVGKTTNVVPIISRFTLNTICETAMGTRLEEDQKDQEDYRKAVYGFGNLMIYRLPRLWFHTTLIFKLFSPKGQLFTNIINTLHGFSNSIIQERKKTFNENDERIRKVIAFENEDLGTYKRKLAMLDLLLYAKAHSANIDDEGIREEVDTFTFEGHDTTAMGICFALFCLANYPDIQENVAAELKEIFEGSNRLPTYKDLMKMQYLERCLKETLRLYPSVPFISRYINEEVILSNYKIPAETMVDIHIYNTHRDPNHYPNPEVFDPDRFLPEVTQKRHPYAYIPFSAGPRNCIGQKFALLEEKAAVSTILRNFRLEAVDTPDTVTFTPDLVLRPSGPIRVKLHSRN